MELESCDDGDKMIIADHRAREKLFQDIFLSYYKDKARNNDFSWVDANWLSDKHRHILAWYGTRFNKPQHMFITINPDYKTIDESKFIDKVRQFSERKWIEAYEYAFEWRKDNRGLHVHIIIRRGNKRPSEIIRECKNTFRKFCGNDRHIFVKMIKEKDVEKVSNYITKNCKVNLTDDDIKVNNDVKQRKVVGVHDLYYAGALLPHAESQ